MVDIREERHEITKAKGKPCGYGVIASVWFNTELYNQILAEAKSRGWTLSHMVRHLCEASIEGIE